MRITRGPSRESGWPNERATTDSKEPSRYIQDWKYRWEGAHGNFEGGSVVLNGTKKRDARRNAELDVWIDDDDVCALFNALLERKAEEERRLRGAMWRISELIGAFERTGTTGLDADSVLQIKDLVRQGLYRVDPLSLFPDNVPTRQSEAPGWNPFRDAEVLVRRRRQSRAAGRHNLAQHGAKRSAGYRGNWEPSPFRDGTTAGPSNAPRLFYEQADAPLGMTNLN